MDNILMSMWGAMIIGAFVILFQKSKTKLHAQIRIVVLSILIILLFLAFIGAYTMVNGEFVGIAVIVMLTCVVFIIVLANKLYKTYLQIKNNKFEKHNESDNNGE